MWRFQAVAALLALPSAWAADGSAVLFMLQDPRAGILHPPAKVSPPKCLIESPAALFLYNPQYILKM
jgi:hypothetical protein